jgi:hypothetical protein
MTTSKTALSPALMKISGIANGALFLGLSISAPTIAAETHLNVPSDPQAQYFVLETGGSGAERTIVTKRVGSSGTSYSNRIYNCQEKTVKYLGTGDTLEEMERSQPGPFMAPIVPGSIAYYVGLKACN